MPHPLRPRVLPAAICLSLFWLSSGLAYATPWSDAASSSQQRVGVLPFRVIDAEFSSQLTAIVAVSESPNRLNVVSPDTAAVAYVALPLAPMCVSVGPDGMFAAVGHDGWVSYVDLVGLKVVKTFSVSAKTGDIVLGGNGYIYILPSVDQWESIHCIEIASSKETTSGGSSIYAGTIAKLHPNGKWMYGADRGLSPSDIEKYDISSGTAQVLRDSPYHGDYEMCGNLWIAEDGRRIFTACGNVFWSSEITSTDMTYGGSLTQLSRIQSLAHSAASGWVAVIPSNGTYYPSPKGNDGEVQFYDYAFLAYDHSVTLPPFPGNGKTFPSHGRFIFQSADGAKQYVILQAPPTSGLLNDFGITTIGGSSSTSCVANVTTLCISDQPGDNRFAITVDWSTAQV